MEEQKTINFTKYIKWFWWIFFGGFLSICLVFLLASWGAFGKLPTFQELENPQSDLATEIISADGETIGKFYIEANRTPITYDDLPEYIIKALVATEDERFYEHSGIDFYGTARAVAYLGKKGGASTITQQLAKNIFHKRENATIIKRLMQKIKEWVIAIKLERQYTKDEILTMYLNRFDFLYNAVGIRSASRIYFQKEPKDLDIQECAVLVAMLKNPFLYNPKRERSVEKSKQRRNVVFAQMAKNELITQEQKDSLQKLPLKINFTPESHNDGIATYFREHLRKELKKWADKNTKPNGEKYDIYKDGLKVYVTIDSRMQKYAEEAVAEHMSNLQKYFSAEQKGNKTAPFYDVDKKSIQRILTQSKKRSERYRRLKQAGVSEKEIEKIFNTKVDMRVFTWKGERDTIMTPYDSIRYYKGFLRSGLLSMEPQTGHIKAWVGGLNNRHFKYESVYQQKRQVGSTFKPFVYATAINQLKFSPCDEFPNTLYTIPKGKYGLDEDWTPENSGGKYGGMKTLKNALANSVNVITARLIDKTTPQNVVRLANSAGITSKILAVPSIALGTVDLSLYEMVTSYATFANKGMYVSPMIIQRIEDKNGVVLQEFRPETREVVNEEAAYVILNLMQGVTEHGSGARLRSWHARPKYLTGYPYKFTNQIAGKTGTTQNQSDGWFMGIVPNLVTGVWTGGEDRSTHFKYIDKGQGASMSLPTWAIYMRKCYQDKELDISKKDFEKPEDLTIEVDCEEKSKENEGENQEGEEKKEENQEENVDDWGM